MLIGSSSGKNRNFLYFKEPAGSLPDQKILPPVPILSQINPVHFTT